MWKWVKNCSFVFLILSHSENIFFTADDIVFFLSCSDHIHSPLLVALSTWRWWSVMLCLIKMLHRGQIILFFPLTCYSVWFASASSLPPSVFQVSLIRFPLSSFIFMIKTLPKHTVIGSTSVHRFILFSNLSSHILHTDLLGVIMPSDCYLSVLTCRHLSIHFLTNTSLQV